MRALEAGQRQALGPLFFAQLAAERAQLMGLCGVERIILRDVLDQQVKDARRECKARRGHGGSRGRNRGR